VASSEQCRIDPTERSASRETIGYDRDAELSIRWAIARDDEEVVGQVSNAAQDASEKRLATKVQQCFVLPHASALATGEHSDTGFHRYPRRSVT
jgi:hypothetical protein